MYNLTAPTTGGLDFTLNYALEPFSCHLEHSRQAAVGLGPSYALSRIFNVDIESNAKLVTWRKSTGNSSTASSGTDASTNPESTASPTPSATTTAGVKASGSSVLSQGARAGVGIGVAMGVLALIAAAATAAFYVLRRRRKASII